MKKTIGGARLGSGSKLAQDLHNYERSTHDLGRVWRSTMGIGTLVPFFTEVALNGDTWDIDLESMVRTVPTVGPLFGTFKLQVDVFVAPMRNYIRQLAYDKRGVGNKMSEIKLPQVELMDIYRSTEDFTGFSGSSLPHYMGVAGVGTPKTWSDKEEVRREFNALPFITYYDIFANYYANKQEKYAYVMSYQAMGKEEGYPEAMSSASSTWTSDVLIDESQPKTIGGEGVTGSVSILFRGASEVNWMYFKQLELWGENGFIAKIADKMINPKIRNGAISGRITEAITFTQLRITAENEKIGTPRQIELEQFNALRDLLLDNENPVFHDNHSGTPMQTLTGQIPYGNKYYGCNKWTQNGLMCKTYQSDLFNTWINTETVGGAGGIAELSAVTVVDGKFTMDQFNIAKKVYNVLNRIAVSGGSYTDWQEAVYGEEVSKRAMCPMYMGGMSSEIVFDEVVSTAASAEDGGQALGTLAGRGTTNGNQKGGKIVIKVQEPSLIMGIVSITPRVDYSQGNKWHMNLKSMDDLHKPAMDGIGWQELITDQMHWATTEVTADATTPPDYKSIGLQPAWINYMTAVNETHGEFADDNKLMWMTLNRKYELSNTLERITDLTSYIDPSKYNYAFADATVGAQNFWVQLGVNAIARRKISAKQIPNL